MGKVLAFAGSARRNGNTRILLDAFVDEARKAGHDVEVIELANRIKWDIKPCLACDYCLTGKCIQKDAMQDLYSKLADADAIVLAGPIQFYALPSQVKAVIDRGQLFFNQFRVKKNQVRNRPCKGFFISCGATKGQKLFEGTVLCVRYWFDALNVEYTGDALFRGIDAPGAIREHPEALEEVRALVRKL